MKNIEWYINRIQAMSSREILWRIRQKCIQKIEKKTLYSKGVPVTEIPLNKKFLTMHPDVNRISMNWNNESNSLFNGMELFGVFDYKKYEKNGMLDFKRTTHGQKLCSLMIFHVVSKKILVIFVQTGN